MTLVLSLFPGIGLLDRAFEEEGFCVVRGPDLLWGGDVRRFHPPSGRFDGVIGGPPCQAFSSCSGGTSTAENLIPEFLRVVREARPAWFVMEEVVQAPDPIIAPYKVWNVEINNREIDRGDGIGEEQSRERRISFGALDHRIADRYGADGFNFSRAVLLNPIKAGCFTANGTQWEPGVDTKRGRLRGRSRSVRTWAEFKRGCRLQGLPEDFDLPGFTAEAAIRAIGNGVPLPLGRAVARAVKRTIVETVGPDGPYVCPGCHAIGGEECAAYCPDASIEREREAREHRDWDDDEEAMW